MKVDVLKTGTKKESKKQKEISKPKEGYEIVGVPEELAREAFRLAAAKLPLRTTFVARMIGQ